ncbi:hypothetical protein J2S13_002736 [Oikeobacillus pervagus]|uniref:Resolvase/invertase-type recombinase catalytic domain-containing protein n=1 Tax=Oikeobacillus pervagus TaxID=1325931 RepID=A0AAJ1T0G1_9BACI|nr:hypothetical protein [Oikeobacillus pervagus]
MEEKVVGYVRVSTEGQVREGYSLAYQVEEIERYCTENKLQLLHIYEDKGLSGATVDEDGLTVCESASEAYVRPRELLSRGIYIRANTSKWETSSNYFINSLKKLAYFTIHTTKVMKNG